MKESTSSPARMLAILDLYTLDHPEWTVEEIARTLGYPGSTAYRYVRELTKVGLLAKMPGATYVVGAKIIELEMLVRHADPLSRLARPFLQELAKQTGCTALLSNVYGKHLINVAYAEGMEPIDLTYLRGTPLPWFRGAPGKAALAFMPAAQSRALFEQSCAGAFDDERWQALRRELKKIRAEGYCVSLGELDESIVGFGAPLMPEGQVIGSISLTCTLQRSEMLSRQGIAEVLRQQAQALEAVVRNRHAGDAPPSQEATETEAG